MRKKPLLLFTALVIVLPIITLASSLGCTSGNNDVVVTYNASGGNVFPLYENIPAGGSVLLPLPIYEGYVFNGWYDQTGTKAGAAGASYVANETITLVAQWTPNEWYGEYLPLYSYEYGFSLYYVDYEIQYYVNDFLFNTHSASAYFDSYATAWAFSLTGGPIPIPYYEERWIDGVNRWWITDEQASYEVYVYDEHNEEGKVYYTGLFPGTAYADDYITVTIDDYTNNVFGTAGPAERRVTHYDKDPGYLEGTDEIEVTESWWTVSYAGYVYGTPDIYTIRFVPTTGIIYDCR